MKNTLARYRDLFRSMIEQNSPTPISNESRLHAAIIIQELVRSAKETVFIQCSNLAPDVYGNSETIREIREAISRGVKFKVAVRGKSPQAKALYEILADSSSSCIQLGTQVFTKDFCVVDGKRARVETDAVIGKAVASAYDEELGSLLNAIFNKFYKAA